MSPHHVDPYPYAYRIQQIDSEIARLQERLADLQEERSRVLGNKTGPFSRVPDDILRQVFDHCFPGDRNPNMSNKEAPMLLTQISSRARRLVLETPSFWSSIHIPLLHSALFQDEDALQAASAMAEKRLNAVTEWLLHRSGQYSLSISLYELRPLSPRNEIVDHANSFAPAMFDVLLQCADRWKSVFFSGTMQSLKQIESFGSERFPRLVSLAFEAKGLHPASLKAWQRMPILSVPNLRELRFLDLPLLSASYNVLWANLTTLSMIAPAEIIDFLGLTPNLVRCTLHVIFPCKQVDIHFDSRPMVSLLKLKTLTLFEFLNNPGRTSILCQLTLPQLESIQYETDHRGSSQPFAYLVHHSGRTIKHITIKVTSINLLQLMQCCPSLVSLRIDTVHSKSSSIGGNNLLADDALTLLTMPGDSCLCRDLEELQILTPCSLSDGAVHEFIVRKQTRLGGIAKLKKLSILLNRVPTVDIPSLLSPEMLQDLDLDVKYTLERLESHPEKYHLLSIGNGTLEYRCTDRC